MCSNSVQSISSVVFVFGVKVEGYGIQRILFWSRQQELLTMDSSNWPLKQEEGIKSIEASDEVPTVGVEAGPAPSPL